MTDKKDAGKNDFREKIYKLLNFHVGPWIRDAGVTKYSTKKEILKLEDIIQQAISEELPKEKIMIKPDLLKYNPEKVGWNDCLEEIKNRLWIDKL
jgi:hypothetical protein